MRMPDGVTETLKAIASRHDAEKWVFESPKCVLITDSLFTDIQKLFQLHHQDCELHFEMNSKAGIIDTGPDLNGFQTNEWDGTVEHRIVVQTRKKT